uniref:Uncharacterized protein n=1 Tax=Anguilla anguilla TaxID=7936 RepID=A0A0E9RLL7_ANGAN
MLRGLSMSLFTACH